MELDATNLRRFDAAQAANETTPIRVQFFPSRTAARAAAAFKCG
jgi:hypothetical protein